MPEGSSSRLGDAEKGVPKNQISRQLVRPLQPQHGPKLCLDPCSQHFHPQHPPHCHLAELINCSSLSIPTKVMAVCGVASFRSVFQTFEKYRVWSSNSQLHPAPVRHGRARQHLQGVEISLIWNNSCPLLPQGTGTDLAVRRLENL